jgi:hypothetical protein
MSTEFVKRPDKGGSAGKTAVVKINVFPIRALAESTCYQYDVKFQAPSRKNPNQLETAKIPNMMATQAFRQVEMKIREKYKSAWIVYDGGALAYSLTKIEDYKFEIVAEKERDIEIPPLQQQSGSGERGRGGDRGGRGGRGDNYYLFRW